MSDAKYSVLFMRDDADVRRYRLNPFWLKVFLFLQVALLLCAGIGFYVGFSSLDGNKDLETENKILEQRLIEAEVRLERLGNMEKILQSYDPKELQALLNSVPAEATTPKAPAINLNSVLAKVDEGLVKVEKMKASSTGKALSVNFDLSNIRSSAPLSGLADFVLVNKDGSTTGVETKKEDLGFMIQRFKRINTSFKLPEGLDIKDVYGLRLEIKSDGKIIFSEIYPVASLLP